MNDRTDQIRSTRAPKLREDQIEVLSRYGKTRRTEAVEFDQSGFVLTGEALDRSALAGGAWEELSREPHLLETNLPGVFAAGDVRSGSIKRVASAVSEGSMAVRLVHQHLADTGS